MITALLWIVGCYVLAAAVIYALSVMRRRQARSVKHYVLIAGNEDQRMEWYMRSLRRFSHLTGTDVKVTVVDNGSEDDTLRIAKVFARRGMDVQFHSGVESGQEESVEKARDLSVLNAKVEQEEASKLQAGASIEEQASSADGRSEKWKRFRAIWRWRMGEQDGSDGVPADEAGTAVKRSKAVESSKAVERSKAVESSKAVEGSKAVKRSKAVEHSKPVKHSKPVEPMHLLWMLQAEGVVSAKEHAVLIDLQNPDDLSKLPF